MQIKILNNSNIEMGNLLELNKRLLTATTTDLGISLNGKMVLYLE